MDDVDTVYTKEPRNLAFEDLDTYDVQVFGHGVKFISACDYDGEYEVKKWCGMFCTTVMKRSNIDGMFSHISLPTFIHSYLTMSGQLTLKKTVDTEMN
jgi:glycerol-3-phosphate cytidylyltransferase-like family protein